MKYKYNLCNTAGTNRIGNNNLTDYKGAEVDNVPNDVQDIVIAVDCFMTLGSRVASSS